MEAPLQCEEIQQGLAGEAIGHRIIWVEETGSTNDDARELARLGAPHGLVVLAEMQRTGRGRRGAQWISPPRQNLLFSIVLRPDVPMELWPRMAHCAAVGIATGLEMWRPSLAPQIKWPNDVYLTGRKMGGILLEVSAQGNAAFAVLGLGLNVNGEDFPSDLPVPATSLRVETGCKVHREEVAGAVLRQLSLWLPRVGEDFSSVLREVRRRSLILGRRVSLLQQDVARCGTVVDFDDSGALLFQPEGEAVETILSADNLRLMP